MSVCPCSSGWVAGPAHFGFGGEPVNLKVSEMEVMTAVTWVSRMVGLKVVDDEKDKQRILFKK